MRCVIVSSAARDPRIPWGGVPGRSGPRPQLSGLRPMWLKEGGEADLELVDRDRHGYLPPVAVQEPVRPPVLVATARLHSSWSPAAQTMRRCLTVVKGCGGGLRPAACPASRVFRCRARHAGGGPRSSRVVVSGRYRGQCRARCRRSCHASPAGGTQHVRPLDRQHRQRGTERPAPRPGRRPRPATALRQRWITEPRA
jgi:hypothetical protein